MFLLRWWPWTFEEQIFYYGDRYLDLETRSKCGGHENTIVYISGNSQRIIKLFGAVYGEWGN